MKILLFGLVLILGWWLYEQHLALSDEREHFVSEQMTLYLSVHGNTLAFSNAEPQTVGDFLRHQGYSVRPEDHIFPAPDTPIASGMTIRYWPARTVTIRVDKEKRSVLTTEGAAADILTSVGVELDEDDIVKPNRETVIASDGVIDITRVEIREEPKDIPIAFTTKTTEDEELSWRKKTVKQKGEKGLKRTIYRVAYHDGKEVSRRVVKTETVKEPVEEIVTQGTLVKTGKSHRGQASWYAWTGTMAAANPWLPKGSYVKVTNLDNGKSVIVVINDRGPFVPGRIIDLDKVAFAKIASIGAGVINVKMEEITN